MLAENVGRRGARLIAYTELYDDQQALLATTSAAAAAAVVAAQEAAGKAEL